MSSLAYRPEIDGLRAFAVVPVVLFHAGIPGFSGGYIGVDIFFVISGFLITSILAKDLHENRFSLLNFYERRARRILPALIVMIALCLPFAWMWMLTSELEDFGKSVIATIFFVSNITFWMQSGYFESETDLKPLLHTWSLAVEEQYYLLFPVFLFLMYRFARRAVLPALILLIICSLALAEWGWRNAPSAAFYLAPTRIWEILIGAVCALLTRDRFFRNHALGLLGLCMIVGPIIGYGPDVPVPSLWTAIPVLGTALVLVFASKGTPAATILGFRPLVGIGLISYSTYLWHQPLLAFARMRSVVLGGGGSTFLVWGLIAASFFLGWLSWKYVEAPFRRTSPRISRKAIFLGAAGCGSALSAAGLALVLFDGVPSRTAPAGMRFSEIASLEEALLPNPGLHKTCDAKDFQPTNLCQNGTNPKALLWGDSFAMHLVQALENSPTDLSFVQATYSGCAPLLGIANQDNNGKWQDCIEFNDTVLSWIISNPSIDLVILSSPFRQADKLFYTRDGSPITAFEQRLNLASEALHRLAATLAEHGKRLVIVSPPALNGIDLGLCDIRRHMMETNTECSFSYEAHQRFNASAIRLLKSAEDRISVIWLPDLTCADGVCKTQLDGVGLYRDDGHLSFAGSANLGKRTDLAGLILSAASH